MNPPKSHTRITTKRVTARLAEGLERKLLSYVAAASAAGVSLLACSLPAEGKIVYTSIFVQIPPNAMVNLDLNGDGIADFQFSNHVSTTNSFHGGGLQGILKVLPQNQSNAIWGVATSASALRP
jgi:hypothetical protein